MPAGGPGKAQGSAELRPAPPWEERGVGAAAAGLFREREPDTPVPALAVAASAEVASSSGSRAGASDLRAVGIALLGQSVPDAMGG